jgi:hypothetical protein
MRQYRERGGKAPSAARRKAEAIRYAEAIRGLNDNPIAIARAHASPGRPPNGFKLRKQVSERNRRVKS